MLIVCNLCKKDGVEFKLPDGSIGIALMEAHFQEKHPTEYEKYLIDKANPEKEVL